MTIRDIAEEAGVSPATVSKVIHGNPDISEATRDKVQAVIEKHQYRPYGELINEQLNDNSRVAVLLDASGTYEWSFLSSLSLALNKVGLDMLTIVQQGSDDESVRENIAALTRQHVGIAIRLGILTENTEGQIRLADGRVIPCLDVIEGYERRKSDISVHGDIAGQKLTEYLLQHGHRHIACLVDESNPGWMEGCRKAMHSYGLKDPVVHSIDVLKENMSAWLPHDCTAVICRRSSDAAEVCSQLYAKGLHVPPDMSVVALIDDCRAECLRPPLTTVDWPMDVLADYVVSRVQAVMNGTTDDVPRSLSDMQWKIKERRSVAAPSMPRSGQKIVVVGSVNMDVNVFLPEIPEAGNVTATSVMQLPGGKGANQAVGVARLGGEAWLIGSVGTDAKAQTIYESLHHDHVRCEGIRSDAHADTGTAYINVTEDGESRIIIYPGANNRLGSEWLNMHEDIFTGASCCLLSTEIPQDAIIGTLYTCRRHDITVLLKPASIDHIAPELLQGLDFLIPNRHELAAIAPAGHDVESRAEALFAAGVRHVLVTLDSEGCYLLDENGGQYYPAMTVTPADTTGGADAFISALAVCISEGMKLPAAIGYANYAAGICVSSQGVQTALPRRDVMRRYSEEIENIYVRNMG